MSFFPTKTHHHGQPVSEGVDREDGIDWPVWTCTCGCGEWGTLWRGLWKT
jgi:hypothetical protein